MKTVIRIISILIIALSVTFCATKQEFQSEFPQEIIAAYYQTNKEDGKTYFFIDLKEQLNSKLQLEEVHFNDKTAVFESISKNTFRAQFNNKSKNTDLILDGNASKEYGNKAPSVKKSKFVLKSNEAVVQYSKKNQKYYFKIINVNERQVR